MFELALKITMGTFALFFFLMFLVSSIGIFSVTFEMISGIDLITAFIRPFFQSLI